MAAADQADRPVSGSDAAPVLLDVRDLHVHYHLNTGLDRSRPVLRAVDGVSLQIRRGETLGLVGESGSGKSTLAKALVRLERAASGQVLFDGTDLLTVRERQFAPLRRRVQMVFQDSLNSLNPRHTVAQTIAEPLLVHRIVPRGRVRERVAELLTMVELSPQLAGNRPSQLSGGQRQRVNIARALASAPQLLIADEPTSALDVSVQAQILNLLRGLQNETGMTYLLISHDLGVVRRMCTRIAVMYLGRVVETSDRDTIYSQPLHPYTVGLLAAAPRPDPRLERQRQQAPIPGEVPSAAAAPPGCHFHPRCSMARNRCASEDPPLREVRPAHWSACHYAEELLAVRVAGAPPAAAAHERSFVSGPRGDTSGP